MSRDREAVLQEAVDAYHADASPLPLSIHYARLKFVCRERDIRLLSYSTVRRRVRSFPLLSDVTQP